MKSNAAPATLLHIVLLLLIGIAVTRVQAAPLVYQLNESIEVSTTGAWDKATVIEVGVAGTDHEGEYKVHFIGYGPNYDRWLQPVYFRKVAAGAPTAGAKAAPPAYQLNENIEVSTTGAWDKATVIEVGVAGTDHEGEYKVHFIGYGPNYDRWLQPIYFRKVAGGAPAAGAAPTAGAVAPAPVGTPSSPPVASATSSAGGPRAGKYNISSYGAVGRPPLFLGHIELQAGGKYRISRKREGDYYGEGTYSFDAAASAVKWLSGPCKEDGWSGTFTSERDGKTHRIRLRSTTIATNTVE